MKIVYVLDTLNIWGGLEKVMSFKMNYLAENYGYKVTLITVSYVDRPQPFYLSPKVEHIHLNFRFYTQYKYSFFKRLYLRIKTNNAFEKKLHNAIDLIKPDIIIASTYCYSDVICNLHCRSKKIIESHVVRTELFNHSQKEFILSKWWKLIREKRYLKSIERRSDALVSLTLYDEKLWNKCNNTFVIPNPLLINSTLKSNQDNKRIITVGRLDRQKGYDLLIDAWSLVVKKHSDWSLDIYGDGLLLNEYQNQIKKNNLCDSLHINKPRVDIMQCYANSSIYVMSSRFEGFGLVLIEAMSCGLPCISFDCKSGPSEIITDGKDGILVKSFNVNYLAESICYLIENENIRRLYGKNAIESAKRYHPDIIMSQWNNLFKTLIESK